MEWTRTTPVFASSPVDSYDLLATNDAISTEAPRRMLRMVLALAGWRHEHGELPERLEMLEGTWFDKLPLDPWTGREFGYEPDGLPEAVRFANRTVAAGQPVVWTAGPHNARIVVWDDAPEDLPKHAMAPAPGWLPPEHERWIQQTQAIALPIP